jgi:hypothetical protein
MKSTTLRRVREEQKVLAEKIRRSRSQFKQSQRDGSPNLRWYCEAEVSSTEYRHRHIAYCLARGRSMDQIERPKEGNEPNLKVAHGILETLRAEMASEQVVETELAGVPET